MKTPIIAWSLCLAAAIVTGCSDAPTSKKESSVGDNSEKDAKSADQAAPDDLSPEDLARMMAGSAPASSEAPVEGTILLGPKLSMRIPDTWERTRPRIPMIAYEFAVPSVEEGQPPGRMTIMAAGGSIKANIERWYGQFTQPDGSNTADKATTEEREIAGHKVHLVDISGTYGESMGGGPFAPGKVVQRPDYRMLAAIVETPEAVYFLKLYGPAKTVDASADVFRKMVEGMAAK